MSLLAATFFAQAVVAEECPTFPAALSSEFKKRAVKLILYDVHGDTPYQIRRSLNEKRPADNFGRGFDGWTRWGISWEWVPSRKDPDFEKTRIKTEITVRLPCLKSETAPKSWGAFIAAAAKHELHHVDSFLAHASGLIEGLVRAASNEPGFNAYDGERFLQAQLNGIRAADKRYDQETNHGKLEGVIFPAS